MDNFDVTWYANNHEYARYNRTIDKTILLLVVILCIHGPTLTFSVLIVFIIIVVVIIVVIFVVGYGVVDRYSPLYLAGMFGAW